MNPFPEKRPPDIAEAQRSVRRFLEALGYASDQPELLETPARVVEAYLNELVVGDRTDIARLIEQDAVSSDSQSLVIVRDIAVATVCPHHLLPAQGSAMVAYLPGTRVLGLGTMTRLVDACCRRLILQERIGPDIAQALMNHAGARGVYCALRFEHACLRLRGARQASAVVETVHVDGILRDPIHTAELMLALGVASAERRRDP